MDTVYCVQAKNLSHASENRIHDDAVARRFGFRGGLVPGVEVYAYMAHCPVARWGRAWMERGTAQCRFLKPVYDGRVVSIRASAAGAALSMSARSDDELCATGSASLPDELAESVEPPVAASVPAPDMRPDADASFLSVGRRLTSHPLTVTQDSMRQYLADIGETETLYAREGLIHPALWLRLSNSALKDNVKLGAWIHVGSAIRHFGVGRIGDELVARGEVKAQYERSGHRFVELDVVIVAAGYRPVAQVRHTAIYRLRQVEHPPSR